MRAVARRRPTSAPARHGAVGPAVPSRSPGVDVAFDARVPSDPDLSPWPASRTSSPRATASSTNCSRSSPDTAGQDRRAASSRCSSGYPDRREELTSVDPRSSSTTATTSSTTIRERLNQTFVTPIDREDILELGSALDDVIDFTEEAADYLGLDGIEAPMEQAQRWRSILLDATRQIALGDPGMRDFSDVSHVTDRDPPARERGRPDRAATRSPRCSRGIDPMVVIRWKDIFERLEQAIDATERVAERDRRDHHQDRDRLRRPAPQLSRRRSPLPGASSPPAGADRSAPRAGRPAAIDPGREVGRDDAVRADHGALADRHAAGDNDVRAEPDVVAERASGPST